MDSTTLLFDGRRREGGREKWGESDGEGGISVKWSSKEILKDKEIR